MGKDDKEINEYIELIQQEVGEESSEINKLTTQYIDLIISGKSEEGLTVLMEETIPKYEETLKEFRNFELHNEDVKDLNEQMINLIELDLSRHEILQGIFTTMKDMGQNNELGKIDIDDELQTLFTTNEDVYDVQTTIYDKLVYMSEEYKGLETDDNIFNEQVKDMDPSNVNEAHTMLVWEFLVGIVDHDLDFDDFLEGQLKENSPQANKDEPTDKNDDSDANNEDINKLLKDQGSPHVVFDAKVTISDTFYITGKSNLEEGSTIKLKSYHYGSENPYLKGETTVAENGDFEIELDLDEDSLNGEPLTLRLGYHPENEHPDIQEHHGEEGEYLEGPFKQKYTNIKRTRYGAFTYALIEFKEGESEQFNVREWNQPNDYGELNIWMKEENIEIHDDYYNITMESNLNELTRIKAKIEVPGYEVAGYTARAYVFRDGSFQFQIPRIEDHDIEENEEIIFVIEAVSNAALETEELYGEHGEHFEGDLVEKTKQGQKIQYQFKLQE